jgi:hypothetical protein
LNPMNNFARQNGVRAYVVAAHGPLDNLLHGNAAWLFTAQKWFSLTEGGYASCRLRLSFADGMPRLVRWSLTAASFCSWAAHGRLDLRCVVWQDRAFGSSFSRLLPIALLTHHARRQRGMCGRLAALLVIAPTCAGKSPTTLIAWRR